MTLTKRRVARSIARLLGSLVMLAMLIGGSAVALSTAANLAADEDPTALNSTKTIPWILGIAMSPSSKAVFDEEIAKPGSRWEVVADVYHRDVTLSFRYGAPADYTHDPGTLGVTSSSTMAGTLDQPIDFYLEYPPVAPPPSKLVQALTPNRYRQGCAQWTDPAGNSHVIKPVAVYQSYFYVLRCRVPAIGKYNSLSLGLDDLVVEKPVRANNVGTEELDFLHPGPTLDTFQGDSDTLRSNDVETALTVPFALTVFSDDGGLESSTGTLLKQTSSLARTVESDTGDVSTFVITNKKALAAAETERQFLWLATGVALGLIPAVLKWIWDAAAALGARNNNTPEQHHLH